MRSDAFRQAAERMDLDATIATMSPSVVLRSPVVSEPFRGVDEVRKVFSILYDVFEDLAFEDQVYASPERNEILHFRWRIGTHHAEGVDMLGFDGAGRIEDYRVMVRPFDALDAMRLRVFSRLSAE